MFLLHNNKNLNLTFIPLQILNLMPENSTNLKVCFSSKGSLDFNLINEKKYTTLLINSKVILFNLKRIALALTYIKLIIIEPLKLLFASMSTSA